MRSGARRGRRLPTRAAGGRVVADEGACAALPGAFRVGDPFRLDAGGIHARLELTALMKADPFKALEAVTPIYQELQRRAGATLPEDLESAVQTGEITEDRARELARLRRSGNSCRSAPTR